MSKTGKIFIISAAVFVLLITAAIAFRISHKTLNAFKTVNESLTRSNDSLDSKSKQSLYQIDTMDASDSVKRSKISEHYYTAIEIKELSDSTIGYIRSLQERIEKQSNGDDDLNIGTKILVQGPDGKMLQKRLERYKVTVDSLMKPYPLSSPIPINTTPPKSSEVRQVSWQQAYFEMVPAVATLTILNKFKNDVQNTESMCMDRLAKESIQTAK